MKAPHLAAVALCASLAVACGSTVQRETLAGAGDTTVAQPAQPDLVAPAPAVVPGTTTRPTAGSSAPTGSGPMAGTTTTPQGPRPQAPATSGGSGTTTTGPGSPAAPAPAPAPGTPSPPPPAPGAPPLQATTGQGFTADQIFIGLNYVASVENSLGVSGNEQGDQQQLHQIMLEHVNGTGGVAGREVVPVYYGYESTTDFSVAQQEECELWTNDQPVAAALTPFGAEITIECLRDANVGQLGGRGTALHHAAMYDEFAGYMEPNALALDVMARSLVEGLDAADYFGDAPKIGLLRYAGENFDAASAAMQAALAERGLALQEEVAIDAADASELAAAISNAVLAFNAAGIDHVMFLQYEGVPSLLFMLQAESQQYRPRYGLSSNEAPGALPENVPPAQLEGSLGIGWIPLLDVYATEDPGTWPARQRCLDIYTAAGRAFASRTGDESYGMGFCDYHTLLQAAWSAGPSLDRQGLANGAASATFESALVGTARLGPGRSWGTASYRPLAFVDGCTCFQYTGDPRLIP